VAAEVLVHRIGCICVFSLSLNSHCLFEQFPGLPFELYKRFSELAAIPSEGDYLEKLDELQAMPVAFSNNKKHAVLAYVDARMRAEHLLVFLNQQCDPLLSRFGQITNGPSEQHNNQIKDDVEQPIISMIFGIIAGRVVLIDIVAHGNRVQ